MPSANLQGMLGRLTGRSGAGCGIPPALGRAEMGRRPKTQNASTTDKLRDLELLNETRETRARTVNRVLDEQFRTRLHPSQQTFITNGDISRNLTML